MSSQDCPDCPESCAQCWANYREGGMPPDCQTKKKEE